jgi:hypothetical protein
MHIQTETTVETASQSPSRRLPKRDYILMPMLSVMTMVVMFGIAELSARAIWPAREDAACDIYDQFGALHARPNCTVRNKLAEGPWVTYHFNECGYRTNASCGPKPSGTIRIVLLGSSVSEGLGVPYEQTFSERTASALAKATGRNVEVENFGFQNLSPLHCYRRLNEALSLKPDLIIYTVSPFDLDQQMDPVQLAHRNDKTGTFTRPATHFKVSWIKLLQKEINDSRAVLIAQHFLFSNTETYLRLYMAYGDRADYLRQPLTPKWQSRFSDFALVLTDMAAGVQRAGVPLILMTVPSRPQAALVSVEHQPPRTNASTFALTIKKSAEQAGVIYVDGLSEFIRDSHCDRFFYSVDSHVTGEGNEILSRALLRKCLPLAAFLGGKATGAAE